jgi:EmrB/QacA subfamily drug resistance transporter
MAGKSKWAVVTVACMAIFIIVLDSSAMNVAISALVEELNTTLSAVQSIIAIYALVMASLMLLGSKIQEIIGRKKAFLVGTIIYGIGSLVATFSVNAAMLLIGWAVLEGIGAALILPATTTLVSAEYEGKDRVVAFGIWGGIAAAGTAVGPIVGGFFTSYLTWRLVFASEIILVIAILLLRSRLSESEPSLSWKELDIVGGILSVISILLIVFGILLLRTPEKWPLVPLLTIPGIALFVVLILWLKRRARKGLDPLFDISLFRVRIFNLGNLDSILQQLPVAGVLFVVPVFLQQVTGVSAIMTGVALLPLSITIFVFSIYGGKFLAILRQPKYVIIAGFIISAVGALVLRGKFSSATGIKDLILGLAIFGTGIGLLLSQLTNITMSAAGAEREAEASGLLNMSKNLGYSLGTALIGVLLIIGVFGGLVTSLEESPELAQMPREQIKQSLFDYFQDMQTAPPQGIPARDTTEAEQIVDSAISSAMRLAFVVLAIILLLGAALSIFVPRQRAET